MPEKLSNDISIVKMLATSMVVRADFKERIFIFLSNLSIAPSLAMVYCPRQYWRGILSPDEALKRGTLFAELHKPFAGDGMK